MPALPGELQPEARPHSLYEGIAYEEFWNGAPKRTLDELEHALVRSLLPVSGYRIIDVGCGYGRLADCYLGRFREVIMIDGSMSLLRQAVERTRGRAMYIAGDVTDLPLRTASFDAVLMIRVFHHIEDSRACLSELRRLLRPDGRLVFSYCNKQNALRVIQWLIRAHAEDPFTIEPAGVGSNLISHHPKAIDSMLRESGFSSMQYYGTGVLDRLAGRFGSTGTWVSPAKRLAPLLAKSRIASWILCRAVADGNAGLVGAKNTGDLLHCPACRGPLSHAKQVYCCLVCNKHYPVEDGIIDLRLQ